MAAHRKKVDAEFTWSERNLAVCLDRIYMKQNVRFEAVYDFGDLTDWFQSTNLVIDHHAAD